MNKRLVAVAVGVVFGLATVFSTPAAFAERHRGHSNARKAPVAGMLLRSLGSSKHSGHNRSGNLRAGTGLARGIGSLLSQAPQGRSGHSSHRRSGNILAGSQGISSLLGQMPQSRHGHSSYGRHGGSGILADALFGAGSSGRGRYGNSGISADALRSVGSWLNRNGAYSPYSGRGCDVAGAYGYGGYGACGPAYPYRHEEDSMARAYRDVGLANAMVNLVGVAATAAATQNVYARPSGSYVREKVIVSPGRYETVRVWVPEAYDPRTGQRLGGGFYETRTQWVPEVAEYRDVWTPTVP